MLDIIDWDLHPALWCSMTCHKGRYYERFKVGSADFYIDLRLHLSYNPCNIFDLVYEGYHATFCDMF